MDRPAILRMSFELREATAAQPLDDTRRSRDEFREWPGIDHWVGCGCVPWVCAPGNKIPLPAVVGNMGLIVTAANTDVAVDGGVTIGVGGTERGKGAGTWAEALTVVITDDDKDADDEAEDEEDDTDDG